MACTPEALQPPPFPQVYQERRLPRPRLPYYMGRVRRMTEL